MADRAHRPTWMAILAKAALADLETCLQPLTNLPRYQCLRSPEIGLAMVRGRAGGTGDAFNLGEITITRCVVQVLPAAAAPITGFGYVAGRSHRHAELAAYCDALLQHPEWHGVIAAAVIEPLAAIAEGQRQRSAAETEATRVNFFTMLRGETS